MNEKQKAVIESLSKWVGMPAPSPSDDFATAFYAAQSHALVIARMPMVDFQEGFLKIQRELPR